MTKPITAADVTREALKILEHELAPKYREKITLQTKDGEIYEFCDYRTGWALFKGGSRGEALKGGMTDDEMFAMMKLLRK